MNPRQIAQTVADTVALSLRIMMGFGIIEQARKSRAGHNAVAGQSSQLRSGEILGIGTALGVAMLERRVFRLPGE